MSLRFLTAGQSHGPSLTAILDGMPAGFSISPVMIEKELARRQKGYGSGGRNHGTVLYWGEVSVHDRVDRRGAKI